MSDVIVFVFGCVVSLIVLSAVIMLLWATGTDRAPESSVAPQEGASPDGSTRARVS